MLLWVGLLHRLAEAPPLLSFGISSQPASSSPSPRIGSELERLLGACCVLHARSENVGHSEGVLARAWRGLASL